MRRRFLLAVQIADPTRLALAAGAGSCGSVGLVCIYRRRHADLVRALITSVPSAEVRLWCLDGDVPPDLRHITCGTGPGSRMELLNRLVAQLPEAQREDGLVLSDDDVVLTVGTLPQLLAAGRTLGLDLFQPAHLATSHSSWPFNGRRFLTFGRETDFVEQGPLVVLSSAAQRALLPLPEDLGMGWGVEVRWWQEARRARLTLGVVDAVGMQHLTLPAGGYDRSEQEAQLQQELGRAGLHDLRQLHRALTRTRPWSRRRRPLSAD